MRLRPSRVVFHQVEEMETDEIILRARGPLVATKDDPYVRSWILLLVDATARNGLTPISKLRLHRLVYLTNCLSLLYRVRANDEGIVKYKRGPFYPVLQWHLDRLVGQDLLHVANVRHFRDERGYWMDANYTVGKLSGSVIAQLCELEEVDVLSRYLLEVTKAYASRKDESLDEVVLADLTYGDSRRAMGSVIDFSFPPDNLSAQGADSFSSLVADPAILSAGDKVHLYVEYLDRVGEGR